MDFISVSIGAGIAVLSMAAITYVQSKRSDKKVNRKKNSGEQEPSGPGRVYVLSNPYFSPGVFKIGFTTKGVDKRKAQLFTTGVPHPYETCLIIESDDYKEIEKDLHRKYSESRISTRREWFKLTGNDLSDIKRDYSDLIIYEDVNAVKRSL